MLEKDLIDEADASPRAKAVFADIKATRETTYLSNFWRALAHDDALLEETWRQVKAAMHSADDDGGALDPHTRELIFLAVSIANGCVYCVPCHTAIARAAGMSEQQFAELLRIVAAAGQTHALAKQLQVPVDEAYMREAD
ncbi:MAG: carboxymuconolactone decarboxylase family protein [Pseudomonadota bacterium]